MVKHAEIFMGIQQASLRRGFFTAVSPTMRLANKDAQYVWFD